MPAVGALFPCAFAPEALPDYARRVESLGYRELWIVEDCFYTGAIAPTTAALAATGRLAVGLGVMPAVMRNAATAAMELSALLRLFPGRVLAGFGHGVASWMEQIGALPASQLAALGETATAVRALLAGETVTVSGQHVRLDGVRLEFPATVPPPIFLGVRAAKSLRLAGQVADGILLSEMSGPGYVRWARERMAAGRADAGRTDACQVTVYAWLALDEEGEWKVRQTLAATLLSQSPSVQLTELSFAADASELARRTPDHDQLARALPREWVEQVAVTGPPESCAKALHDLHAAGADTVVLVPTAKTPDSALRQLEEVSPTVLPALR
ncbi:LLM class flavin-dependent oxidoreductase [Actinopolymorpha alba]|uniref:LLM class flavin-dependent oxidoreductase n=1 Tax=Actinopolymorpha alba TaxID=533267 RepID=UPI000367BF1C|nr:LLM class flavin-dependent oxidoreductase [Actinopolymorpha alba]